MLGAVVHFLVKPGCCRAAIVTGGSKLVLDLQVMANGPHDLDIGYDRPYWVGGITKGMAVGQWHFACDDCQNPLAFDSLHC